MVAYNTSKGGMHAMTMALALDHAVDHIRINCVCPGAIETPIIDEMLERAPDLQPFGPRSAPNIR